MIKHIFKKWCHYKGKYWYKNVKAFFYFLKEIKYFLETGLLYESTYELHSYWINHTLECLKQYRFSKCGYPTYVGSEEEWNNILDSMINYLSIMKQYQDDYWFDDKREMLYEGAKTRFFELFKEYLETLWD